MKFLYNSELQFLEALYEATANNKIIWAIVDDDNREIFQTTIDSEVVQIEFIYFKDSTGETSESLIAIVSGLKVYIRTSVGTPAYNIVTNMLSINIIGWSQGLEKSKASLTKAASRVRKLVSDI